MVDSRRVSAALGFTLLIGCVIGIVILIHNSGTSRRASFGPASGVSDGAKDRHHHHPFVNRKREGNGLVSEANYRSSQQPTMQEMNELAEELQRLLSPRSKSIVENIVNGTVVNNGKQKKKNNGSLLMLDHHQKPVPHRPPPTTSTVTGIKKASISAINYSNIPGNVNPNNNVPPRHQGHQKNQLPPNPNQISSELPRPPPPMMAGTAGGIGEQPGFGRERGGLPTDLYKSPWLQSMIASAPGVVHPSSSSSGHSNVTNLIPHRPPKYPPQLPNNHYHINGERPLRPSPPHINGNHRANIPFLPPIGINGSRPAPPPPQRNRVGDPSKIPTPPQHHQRPDIITGGEEDTFHDLSEEEEEEDFGHGNRPVDNNNVHRDDDDEDPGDDDVEWEEDSSSFSDDDQDPKNKSADLEPKDFVADFGTLFQLANHLYTSPSSSNNKSGSLFQGFLKVVNETIERGNDMRLLVELNEMYEGRLRKEQGQGINGTGSSKTTSEMLKYQLEQEQNHNNKKTISPNETSLTAFIFMSFGVFLLNQIHSFVQKSGYQSSLNGPDKRLNNDTDAEGSPALGRALLGQDFFDWYIEPLTSSSTSTEEGGGGSSLFLGREPSSLDILFEEPKDLLQKNDTSPQLEEGQWRGRSMDDGNNIDDNNSFSSSQHVNNMFRALLNIVNAYTKDSEVMECIWSLYCQDLDNTAGKRGLYGVAARINSVGLRLIMNQIPPSLTWDVILRSLVGWDGLPCRKMFPACEVGNGTILLVDDDDHAKLKPTTKGGKLHHSF